MRSVPPRGSGWLVTLPIVHCRLPISCERINQLTFDNWKLAMLRATRYPVCVKTLKDATGLSGGVSRSLLLKNQPTLGCHGLAPWRFTLAAKCGPQKANSKQRETPPRKAVASSKVGCRSFLAANVNLPRTSRGHPPTVFTQSLPRGGTDSIATESRDKERYQHWD